MVKLQSIEVDVEALVVASKARRKIQRAHRENLRVDQHVLGQRQREPGQRLLRVGGQEAAAGFDEACAFRARIDRDDLEGWVDQPRQR